MTRKIDPRKLQIAVAGSEYLEALDTGNIRALRRLEQQHADDPEITAELLAVVVAAVEEVMDDDHNLVQIPEKIFWLRG